MANPETMNRFSFAFDVNKLLVPTPAEYDNNGVLVRGKGANRSVLNALFSSFSDAPGGFAEELREIKISAGVEAGFGNRLFLRTGLQLEHRTKGNRKYLGCGVGYAGNTQDQGWGIDFAYMVGIGTGVLSPFRNMYALTCSFSVGSFQ